MNKKITLLFTATALYFLPAFSQVSTSTDNDNGIDSLQGFQADVAMMQTGEEHDAVCAANQLRLLKRDYIDKKFQLGRYSPEFIAAHPKQIGPNTPQASCSNVNFESGDFTSWNGAIGDNNVSNAGPLSNIVNGFFTTGNDSPITDANARHTIITSAYGNDPYGGFPGVPPGSGNYTVRLGGQTPNYQGEIIEQTFVVSPASTSFAYRYAVVLNDPQVGHAYTDKPYFKIEVLDQNNQPISTCTQYFVVADAASLTGFTLSPLTPPTGGVAYYKAWTDVNFDLSGYVNQNVTVRFTVGGCTQSGHFGYCYLDCSCSSFAANVNFCPGNTFLWLNAPAGYGTYQWFDPNHIAIPGATNDTLFVNNPVVGDTFWVYLVSGVDTSCHNLLPVVLHYTAILPNATATNPSCTGFGDGAATALGTSGYAPYIYEWLTSPIQATQTISGLSPGTYIVHMTDSLGCQAWDTVQVVDPPRPDTSIVLYHYCPGNPNVIFYAPPGYTNYVWTDPSGNPIPNGNPAYTVVIVNPVVGSQYNCILTPNPGCPILDSVIIPVLQWTDVVATAVSTGVSCFGYTNGTASTSAALGILPYTYNWNTSPAQTTAAISNLAAGTYIVHVVDSMGCQGYDTVVVTTPLRLDTSLFTYTYCTGDPHLTMFAPSGYSSYTWVGPSNDTLAVNSPVNNILISNPQIGAEYLCILNNPPACPIYDTTVLTFAPPSYFFNPDSTVNVFTPNGDMRNDIFYPYFDFSIYNQTPASLQPQYDFFAFHIKTYEIWIYDRWGNQVFYSNDYKFGWDGTVDKGKNCTDGVYYWVCQMTSACSFDNTPPTVSKGFVHLLR